MIEKNTIMWRKIENKVIQFEEFNMNERRCYNVSVLTNHHQDKENYFEALMMVY